MTKTEMKTEQRHPGLEHKMTPETVERFGMDSPLERPGQPNKVTPSFLNLARQVSSYMPGQLFTRMVVKLYRAS